MDCEYNFKTVQDAVIEPDRLYWEQKDIMIAQKIIDEEHLIRVVHTKKDNDKSDYILSS